MVPVKSGPTSTQQPGKQVKYALNAIVVATKQPIIPIFTANISLGDYFLSNAPLLPTFFYFFFIFFFFYYYYFFFISKYGLFKLENYPLSQRRSWSVYKMCGKIFFTLLTVLSYQKLPTPTSYFFLHEKFEGSPRTPSDIPCP